MLICCRSLRNTINLPSLYKLGAPKNRKPFDEQKRKKKKRKKKNIYIYIYIYFSINTLLLHEKEEKQKNQAKFYLNPKPTKQEKENLRQKLAQSSLQKMPIETKEKKNMGRDIALPTNNERKGFEESLSGI